MNYNQYVQITQFQIWLVLLSVQYQVCNTVPFAIMPSVRSRHSPSPKTAIL